MPDTTFTSTELTSQYAAQVASDLERNAKEQDRIGAEIAALQEQLVALQHDHTVLVNMQKALGTLGVPTDTTSSPEAAAVPAPRDEAPAKSTTAKRSRAKKADAEPSGKKPRKSTAKATAKTTAKTATAKPTLVELIRDHLTQQREPRSAAEVATALGQAHPDRGIKTTVVRTTLEGLVAKSQAQRAKQGSSVFYTATDAPAQPEPSQTEAEPTQADS